MDARPCKHVVMEHKARALVDKRPVHGIKIIHPLLPRNLEFGMKLLGYLIKESKAAIHLDDQFGIPVLLNFLYRVGV